MIVAPKAAGTARRRPPYALPPFAAPRIVASTVVVRLCVHDRGQGYAAEVRCQRRCSQVPCPLICRFANLEEQAGGGEAQVRTILRQRGQLLGYVQAADARAGCSKAFAPRTLVRGAKWRDPVREHFARRSVMDLTRTASPRVHEGRTQGLGVCHLRGQRSAM